MAKAKTDKPRGVLNLEAGEAKFDLSRYEPSAELRFFVEHYWIVAWDLRGQEPYLQETLPYPCVHLIFEKDKSAILGVMTGKFSTILQDQGRVFGIKFRPGAFYPFLQSPVSELTDSSLPIEEVFGLEGKRLEAAILALENKGALVELAEDFLRQRLPEPDETVETINRIVNYIIAHREVIKVEDVVSRFHLSKRTLQRIFSQYVGVSPKWVIKRYRLHEAAEQLAGAGSVDWSQLAVELGYFDQAHFIKDFKTIVGATPGEYVRSLG
jgi:AraC-like DNA-binding protein